MNKQNRVMVDLYKIALPVLATEAGIDDLEFGGLIHAVGETVAVWNFSDSPIKIRAGKSSGLWATDIPAHMRTVNSHIRHLDGIAELRQLFREIAADRAAGRA